MYLTQDFNFTFTLLQLNTSLDGLLTNLVHGDHCAKYQITSFAATNVFIGTVNHTCDAVTAFCPCSMVCFSSILYYYYLYIFNLVALKTCIYLYLQTDRLCLNCHRMEQTDCECPCECPLEMNLCNGQLFNNEDKNAICPPFVEHLRAPLVKRHLLDSIHSCFEMHCYNKNTEK